MGSLKLICIFSILISFKLAYAMKQEPWIYGTLEEVSYIKNNSNQVETVLSFKLEKHHGLRSSEVINYMKFRVYSPGGLWDGVKYPEEIAIPNRLGEQVLIYLKKINGKLYIKRVNSSPNNKLVESLPGTETKTSYQLGSLAMDESKKRKPAQIGSEKTVALEDFGFFTFSLFLIVFGVSLYFVSRKNNYD